jgi:flagellar basal-body rod modification protein FlgD
MTVNGVMATTPAAPTTGSGGTDPNQVANNAESTFLKLLVTELQSQDPTSPMDATQMVGQMLSMNQLNELIAINQTLQNAFSGTSGSTASGTTTTASSANPSIIGAH